MSNRFDDMRVKGINTNDATALPTDILQGKTAYAGGQKITGTLVPSGGSGDLNVFVQTTEPTKKEGLWIKESKTNGDVFVSAYNTKKGQFVSSYGYNYLLAQNTIWGQCIVGNYLYSFEVGGSYQYNLRTKEKVRDINFPTSLEIYSNSSCVYNPSDNKIYFFSSGDNYRQGYKIIYDVANNTYTTTRTGTGNRVYGSPHISNEVIYFSGGTTYDIATGTFDRATTSADSGSMFYGGTGGGGILYRSSNGIALKKEDRINNNITTILSDMRPSGKTGYYSRAMFLRGNYLYIFYGSGSGTANNYSADFYAIYNITDSSIKYIDCETYTIYVGISDNTVLLDVGGGMLYIRTAYTADKHYLSVMQFEENDYIDSMSNGDVLLVQNFVYDNPVEIISNPQIHIGILDTYIKKQDNLDNVHPAYWGDGDRWHIFKNPTSETCTVTFDVAGGTGTIPSQIIIAGNSITEPSTIPSKNGEVFNGWYLGNEPFDFSEKISTDTTLTAHYLAYEEIDYIQSTGTQFIDTGFKPNQNTNVELDCEYITGSEYSTLAGARVQSGSNAFAFWVRNSDRLLALNFGTYDSSYITGTELNGRKTIKNVGCSLYVNNVQVASSSSSNFTSPYSLVLFGINDNGTMSSRSTVMKLYNAKIYDNGTLVHNFQPIKITSTSEYCLLDKVENKIYRNAGTGDFVAGEVVNNG